MATWSKLFTNFAWKNRPDTSTPLGQTLLNRLNTALNGIDDRVVTLNAEKASTADLNGSIVNVRLDEKTGIFTFTRFDGTTFTINTALEEVVTNFKYDNATQQLVLTLSDGTTQDVDLSALITQYEFTNSATILWTITEEGKVVGNIKPNSITDQMLQTNYLADITTQANTAVSASQSALESQSLAEQHAEEADEQADRAKAEADRAEEAAEKAEAITGITVDTTLDTNSYNPIANKAVAEAFDNVDAKTLDGHGAEYFLPMSGGEVSSIAVSPIRVNNIGGNAKTLFGFLNNGELQGYLGFKGKEKPFYQNTTGGEFDLLHTGNMADHVLPLTGGTLTKGSKITFEKSDDSTLNGNVDVSVSKNSFGISEKGGSVRGVTLDLTECANWNGSKLLHTGNMASHVLPLSGGGIVTKNGTKVMGIQNTNSEYTLFTFYGNTGELGSLGFDGADIPVFRPIAGSTYKLLHTGNKPTGTYTGNGDPNWRAIDVANAIGEAVVIASEKGVGIVTAKGVIGKDGNTNIIGISSADCFYDFTNHRIAIMSANDILNASGVTYRWSIL